ncbi:MAG TPA: sialidase family protein [Ohtaekwangia sp.]
MIRLVWLALLMVFTFPAFSQFKNIRVNTGATGNTHDPGIAINPKNPKNIVVVSSPDQVFSTLDAGATWQTAKLSSPWGIYGGVTLVADNKGDFYVLYLSDESGEGLKNEKSLDYVVCQISRDGGITWDAATTVAYAPGKDQLGIGAVIDGKDNLHVAWTQLDKYNSTDENCTSVIMYSRSSNGKKWEVPFQLSQAPGHCKDDNIVMGAQPAGSNDGKLFFVVWANQNKVFLDRSFNSGSMWLRNDIGIFDDPGSWKFNVPGHDQSNGLPRFVMDRSKSNMQGALYMVWADQRKGADDTDVWLIRSTNMGDNWGNTIRVNDDEPGKHQYLPAMTLDQATGYLYVVYYDRRSYDDNQTDVYLAYSIDAGLTFKNVKISEAPFTPDASVPFGDHITVTAYKGVITPVWIRTDDGKTSVMTTVINYTDLAPPAKKP